MNSCANPAVRDALPDLLHGRLDERQRAQVEGHLRQCAACREEFELLRALRAAAPGPDVDVARIVAALPAPRRRSASRTYVWQIAAAVAFLAVGSSSVILYRRAHERGGQAAIATVATRQDSAGESATASGVETGDVELSVGYGYTDLTDAQLEALLNDVKDLKAVPMTDPDVSIPDVTVSNGGT